jgi:hypothetical protein
LLKLFKTFDEFVLFFELALGLYGPDKHPEPLESYGGLGPVDGPVEDPLGDITKAGLHL